MSLIVDKQNNFAIPVSPHDLPKLDAMRRDQQQLTLIVDRTAIRPSDGAAYLHGRIVAVSVNQQIESLNREIELLNFALGEQQKEIEDLKNILPDPPKTIKPKAKKKMDDNS